MTIKTNARLAGFAFLFYIAAGIATMALAGKPAAGVFSLLTSFAALVLGVTFYAMTRDQDPDLALLAMVCRVVEAVPGVGGTGAVYFAVASTIFSWLLLRGRMIPSALAWLGVVASTMLAALLVVQRLGIFGNALNWSSPITWLVWLPMLIFEVTVGVWLIVKGVAGPDMRRAGL
jgi:hypothetical protein